ncbi:hypothetical protein H2509_15100, partial [Stappia sp. F7233]
GIGNAIKTLEAADNGIKAITKLVESAQSTVRQAQQNNTDAEAETQIQGLAAVDTTGVSAGTTQQRVLDQNLGALNFKNGDTIELTATDANGTESKVTYTVGATPATETVNDVINRINNSGVAKASVTSDGRLDIRANGAETLNLTITTQDTGNGSTADLITQNAAGSVFASLGFGDNADAVGVDDENDANTTADVDDPGGTRVVYTEGTSANLFDTLTITNQAQAQEADNSDLAEQFNDILQQIDELAADASFNGINLINSSDTELTVAFNERRDEGRSELTIGGRDLTSFGLSLTGAFDLGAVESEDKLNQLANALTTLRATGSQFGSQLTTVNIREDFTKELVNTLQTGADNLVLADTNEEGANLLALQTRQQLSTTALSLSSQADQAVLRLF